MNPEYNNDSQPTPGQQQPNPQYGASSAGSPVPKNKKALLWAVVAIVVLVVIGILVFFMNRSSNKKDDSTTKTSTSSNSTENSGNSNNTANGSFEKYDVTDPLGNYSVSFFKGATALDKNGLHYLVAGNEGSQTSAYISLGSGTEIDCQGSPSTTMKVAGQSIKVCYREDGKVYSGQLAVKGVATRVNVAGQQRVSMEDAKAILESFSFK